MEENGFIYSSWGDPELEDMWYRMQKKAKETEEEKKRKRTEELRKDMENVNHTKIEKDFAKTLVCDGAILECPQGYFDYPVPDIHEADDRYMPDSVTATRTEMIKFNDKGTQGLLSSGNAPTGFQRAPQDIKGSSLLSSSGPSGAVSENGNNKKELVSKVLGVSSALPMTNSFANGIGSSLAGMFGGLSSFGASNLYDQNKQNIIDISKWAMVYGEGTSTKDVLIQADLGSGKTMELYFPKMYVYSFNQDFSIGNGEGYFVLDLKQTGFNEEGITLK